MVSGCQTTAVLSGSGSVCIVRSRNVAAAMALAGAFPLPSIAGDDRRGIAEEVLLEEDEDEEDESSEDESTSFEETDDDSGADARGSASGRLLPTRVRSQDPRALEVVIEAALGPNPTVSRTPSPWELDSMDDTQERFTTEHRAR